MSKTESIAPVEAGTNLTYTITASNNGPSDASEVGITDTLPTETTFVSATPTQGDWGETAGAVTCDLGDLAAGQSAQVIIVVLVDISLAEGAVITNSAVS